jgi:Lon protease-like protein
LQPGWEDVDWGARPIYPVVCLGRAQVVERLPKGGYYIVLEGLHRARILEEVKTDRLYRVARVEILRDVTVASETFERQLRQQFARKALEFFAEEGERFQDLIEMFESDISLGELCDIFSAALPMVPIARQELLAEPRVEKRAKLLMGILDVFERLTQEIKSRNRSYPPEFSGN